MASRRGLLVLIGLLLASSCQARSFAKPQRPTLRPLRRRTAKTAPALPSGNSTVTASVFNLVNNVAGAGILALSAGQAKGTGWIPSIAIATVLGWLSGEAFVMVGEACDMLHEADFKVRLCL